MSKLRRLVREIVRRELSEAIKKKRVVRNGKRKTTYTSTKDGYKIVMKDGKPREVKMSSKERRKRSRSSTRSSKKQSSASKKRAAKKAKRSKNKR